MNFCERARSEAFFCRGLVPVLQDGHFVAKKIVADYLASAKLGDLLVVTNELLEMKGASFTLLQTIYKEEKKLFEMQITLVYISFEGRPQKLESQTKELILSLFGI